jgi:hypothetical protein
MHQFRSKSTILRFKVASLLLCLRCLLAPLASITFLYAVFQDDRKLAHVGIGLGVAAVVSTLSQWILAARALPVVPDPGARLQGLLQTPARPSLSGQLPPEGGTVDLVQKHLPLPLLLGEVRHESPPPSALKISRDSWD